MRAYGQPVNLKLVLVALAVALVALSLAYTNRMVRQLREREAYVVALQARAFEEQTRIAAESFNPYAADLSALAARLRTAPGLSDSLRTRYGEALAWAEAMPPPGEAGFIAEHIVRPNTFEIPSVLTDESGTPLFWRSVPIDSASTAADLTPAQRQRLDALVTEMDTRHAPVRVVLDLPDTAPIVQQIHYGDSALVQELRLFPYIQTAFGVLLALVAYGAFSYVRRSEQASLWAGMAKEAAHQLGTPISSLMGWNELLRAAPDDDALRDEATQEIEKDIARLQRVTNRFSSIGSKPKLEPQPLEPLVEQTVGYLRRRVPTSRRVVLTVDVPDDLAAAVNPDLFAWVIENLVKNALDALDGPGSIAVTGGHSDDGGVWLDVADTGKGIDRRDAANVFRPGFSTKTRGWGLGLSLAQRIAEQYHGGRLRLVQTRTTTPTGTTFRFELPRSDA